MPLLIEDDAVATLARKLARKRRTTVQEVVRRALKRELAEHEADRAAHRVELRDIQARVRKAWQGPLTSNHDFLYDDNGDPVL